MKTDVARAVGYMRLAVAPSTAAGRGRFRPQLRAPDEDMTAVFGLFDRVWSIGADDVTEFSVLRLDEEHELASWTEYRNGIGRRSGMFVRGGR
jgi:hypothetical protein